MRSISPLLAVRFTASNRAGSPASSMSILAAVNPASSTQAIFLSLRRPGRSFMSESQ